MGIFTARCIDLKNLSMYFLIKVKQDISLTLNMTHFFCRCIDLKI